MHTYCTDRKNRQRSERVKAMENQQITLRAYAKINLTLEVLGERPDGYHELRTVMHRIGIFDTVTIEVYPCEGEKAERIAVLCTEALPAANTARRAAESYLAAKGMDLAREGIELSISIEKGIPTEAGLGGASADAAAVLRGMEKLFGALPKAQLYAIGKKIGADVPFCLHGGCALCEGIGEKMTDYPPAKLHLLVVKGERGVSTGALFRALPNDPQKKASGTAAAMKEALKSGKAEAVAERMMNDLSPAAEQLVPDIAKYRRRLLALGAIGAMMSGSGSAVYGIFASAEDAIRAMAGFGNCAFRQVTATIRE